MGTPYEHVGYFLRHLVVVARGLPSDKIDLLYLLQRFEDAAEHRRSNRLPSQEPSPEAIEAYLARWPGLIQDAAKKAIQDGRARDLADMVGFLHLISMHLIFIAVYLTIHARPADWQKKMYRGLPSFFQLARMAARYAENIAFWKRVSCQTDWPEQATGELGELFNRCDQIVYRIREFKKTDRTLTRFVPRLMRHSTKATVLYVTRWIQLCQDLAHLVPDITYFKQTEAKILQLMGERVASPDTTDASPPQYVTLQQMSAIVNRSKRTLEKLKNRKTNPLAHPDAEGGGGKPDEWIWSKVRPWLETEYGRKLPEQFPHSRFVDARAHRS
jgi:hypothetical protein